MQQGQCGWSSRACAVRSMWQDSCEHAWFHQVSVDADGILDQGEPGMLSVPQRKSGVGGRRGCLSVRKAFQAPGWDLSLHGGESQEQKP